MYGQDNCLPGGKIAYPRTSGGQAGGVGTYENPITFAGTKKNMPVHTLIYVSKLQKYFIFEDDCDECDNAWPGKGYHFDLWMGPDKVEPGSGLIACEDKLTGDDSWHHLIDVEVDAAPNQPVNTTALFDGNTCIEHAPPCHNDGTSCGNYCPIPKSFSCSDLETLLYLSPSRFQQLNPDINCSKDIAKGTQVCMGGPCGD